MKHPIITILLTLSMAVVLYGNANAQTTIFTEDFESLPSIVGPVDPMYRSPGNGTNWWSASSDTSGLDPTVADRTTMWWGVRHGGPDDNGLVIRTGTSPSGFDNTFVTGPTLNFGVGETITMSFDYNSSGATAPGGVLHMDYSYNGVDWTEFGGAFSSTNGDTSLKNFSSSFTSTGATGLLRIRNASTANFGNDFVIDNVSATSTANVPEPTTTLLSVIAGSLLVLRRRRR